MKSGSIPVVACSLLILASTASVGGRAAARGAGPIPPRAAPYK